MFLKRKVKIVNVNGLHARPATRFVEIANKFDSEIKIFAKGKEADGKSVIDLLTLAAEKGTELIITAHGDDAPEALDALRGLISDKFEEEQMETIMGLGVSPGVVVREAFVYETEGYRIPRHLITPKEVPHEIKRLEKALEEASKEIDALEREVSIKLGSEIGAIFGTHRTILHDERLKREFIERIEKTKFTPEYSISLSLRVYIRKLRVVEDPFLSERVSDIFDIERRLLRKLLGEKKQELKALTDEVVLVAHDLSPSETVSLDTTKVKGFATDVGGRTSHSAIVAKALGIPAVVGLGNVTTDVFGGDYVIIDGNHGIVIVRPDEKTLREYRTREKKIRVFEVKLSAELKDVPAETPDGRLISLLGNIESPKEISTTLEHGAGGIGLYRTEFLYLGTDALPTEADHFNAYSEAVRELGDKPIIIRTVDLGADKFISGDGHRERNPFLGCRSIRYCFEHPDIFTAQIRAILRASANGNIKILFPLISSLQELRQAKHMVRKVMDELSHEGIPFDDKIQMGVMIEVPSAVIIADALAKEVNFFSIGTNDLIQYSLAVDRDNERVAYLYSQAHPAILRLLKMTIKAAEENNIPVGICGEMGSDLEFTILLVGLGLSELSVAPAMIIPEVKKVIRSITYEDAKKIAENICSFDDPDKTTKHLRGIATEILPEIFCN
ncbi:MAG TPA: phosphoenolpyruvate--protein phosphotransferase [Candidatus Brocadiia bacterium]|nr:phosphoenolpyruvate--protein phosphotransferase [Planctomycetota bacterium]MDO8094094.1 phosphoenolpyruvate--protein phosphotransferase [Candidatus Brocadiales bacterium]